MPVDGTVFVYSFPTFDLVHSLRHRSRITDCDVYLELLVTSCDDDTIYAWDLASGRCIYVIHDFPDTGIVYSATFSVTIVDTGDPSVGVASSGTQGVMQMNSIRIVVWRGTFFLPLFWICEVSLIESCMQEAHKVKNIDQDSWLVHKVHSNGDISCTRALGRTIATGSSDSTVSLWDVLTGERRWVLIGHTSPIIHVDLDRTRMYSTSKDLSLRIWNLQTGESLCILDSLKPSPHEGQTPISDRLIMSYHYTAPWEWNAVQVWDHASGSLIYQVEDVFKPALSEDRRRIVAVRKDEELWIGKRIGIWDVQSGRLQRELACDGVENVYECCCRGRLCLVAVRRDGQPWLDIWDLGEDGREKVASRVVADKGVREPESANVELDTLQSNVMGLADTSKGPRAGQPPMRVHGFVISRLKRWLALH
ncbi:hypothetical protein CVT26_004256 [Gymnopilus dilepis]|uniref:Uncharacterized protein n=1 Tax=Gymnopilus dilepis TaxID=231916 RepID=A0A409YVC8_9AGAR|nr:hypothetical protein CVT26_004256 [Gymnopilus dilepis]